jgi:translation initiation factor 4G
MSLDGSRDPGELNFQQVGFDVWAVSGSGSGPRPPPKAGDISNFGEINITQPLTFGSSSVFPGGAKNKREAISRINSSWDMFSMLSSQGAEAGDKGKSK